MCTVLLSLVQACINVNFLHFGLNLAYIPLEDGSLGRGSENGY